MPHQEALTLVAPIANDRLVSLSELLTEMGKDPGHNAVIPFARLDGCHFGRILVWEPTEDLDGTPIRGQLVLLSECDGSADDHLRALVHTSDAGLDALYSHCDGYPTAPTPENRLRYLKRHRVRESAHYVHRPGRTLKQILAEAELRAAIERFVNGREWSGQTASAARQRIVEHVRQVPELSWALEQPEPMGWPHRLSECVDKVARPLAALAASPVLAPAGALGLGLIRLREQFDPSPHVRPTATQLDGLTALEDHSAHSAYTAGAFVKRGLLRTLALNFALQVIDYGVRHLLTEASLAGITTIHCARWIPMDNGRRMIFASNYNDDFINLLGWGLNFVFSNGEGYPRARWLVFGGAYYEQDFKDYLRCHQIPTPVSYTGYPRLSTANIERNAHLRAGLSRDMKSEKEAQAWLRLL
jgi:hypothetical protein